MEGGRLRSVFVLDPSWWSLSFYVLLLNRTTLCGGAKWVTSEIYFFSFSLFKCISMFITSIVFFMLLLIDIRDARRNTHCFSLLSPSFFYTLSLSLLSALSLSVFSLPLYFSLSLFSLSFSLSLSFLSLSLFSLSVSLSFFVPPSLPLSHGMCDSGHPFGDFRNHCRKNTFLDSIMSKAESSNFVLKGRDIQ